MLEKLIRFIKAEFKIPPEAIAIAKKNRHLDSNTLPIVLWQYGFLNTQQLDEVFNWLEWE